MTSQTKMQARIHETLAAHLTVPFHPDMSSEPLTVGKIMVDTYYEGSPDFNLAPDELAGATNASDVQVFRADNLFAPGVRTTAYAHAPVDRLPTLCGVQIEGGRTLQYLASEQGLTVVSGFAYDTAPYRDTYTWQGIPADYRQAIADTVLQAFLEA